MSGFKWTQKNATKNFTFTFPLHTYKPCCLHPSVWLLWLFIVSLHYSIWTVWWTFLPLLIPWAKFPRGEGKSPIELFSQPDTHLSFCVQMTMVMGISHQHFHPHTGFYVLLLVAAGLAPSFQDPVPLPLWVYFTQRCTGPGGVFWKACLLKSHPHNRTTT